MPALQKFLQAELYRRDWSIETFARRVPLSVSRAYQIVHEGQDNVRQSTFERIAASLDLTAADLSVRTGSGQGELDAYDLEWLDLGRLVPLDQRATIARIVRAAANTSDAPTANTPGRRVNTRKGAAHTADKISSTPGLRRAWAGFAAMVNSAFAHRGLELTVA